MLILYPWLTSLSRRNEQNSENMKMLLLLNYIFCKCITGLCGQPTLLVLLCRMQIGYSFSYSMLFTGPGAASVKGKKVVAGVASFAFDPPGIGTVFARVSSVVSWIKKNSDAGAYDCWKKGK